MNSSGVNCTLIAEGQSCLKIVLNLCGTLYLLFNWLGGKKTSFIFSWILILVAHRGGQFILTFYINKKHKKKTTFPQFLLPGHS